MTYDCHVGTAPWLADHRVHGVAILPGSLYVEIARSMEHETRGSAPRIVRKLRCDRPLVFGGERMLVRAKIRELGDGRVEYTFDEGEAGSPTQPAARLEIERTATSIGSGMAETRSIDEFKQQASEVIEANRLYASLRANGNDYGPAFQRILSVWRKGTHSLGMISLSQGAGERPHTSLIDSMVQLLAASLAGKGRTFLLRSIASIELSDVELPETVWVHAELDPDRGEGRSIGHAQAFGASGKALLNVSGIEISLVEPAAVGGSPFSTKLVVAANFTAEPIEDALNFWDRFLGSPTRAEFAPYGQVFPQLLDANSAFHRNPDGVNVILLRLESWAASDRPGHLTLDADRADRCFANLQQHVLPNGLRIAHWKRHETEYLYDEIFENECYLRNGISLPDDATVLDVGANIGMFSLFVMSRCRNPRIYAFEPAPAIHEVLKANCAAYGKAVPVCAGVSDRDGSAAFTFYESSSVFSGFRADENVDGAAIRAIVRNTLRSATSLDDQSVERQVEDLTSGRLRSQTHECKLTTVSSFLAENGIDRVDLLKIDAEKSELAILCGIDDRDWAKIAQIVVEIHDRSDEALQSVQSLLAAKGFRSSVERETLLENSGLVNLYATRNAKNVIAPARSSGLQRTVGDFSAALAAFREHCATPLVLCVCPRTPLPAGKADLTERLDAAEADLLEQARALRDVRTVSSASLLQRYVLADYYDPHGDRLGDIPYTPGGYAAIGTAIRRAADSFATNPFKVIVLDCDNTLWQGECAEDGARCISIGKPHQALQQFMLEQQRAGMLLCLCSKNNESDVFEVLDNRTDMLLRREHLAAWRINWESKSRNLSALAAELNLGLDSFIFLDDNPLDCADVRAHCPEVLTLQLPGDPASIPAFLDHVWAFDRSGATDEDRNRTQMMRESAARERLRTSAGSMKDFIDRLELRVQITDPTPDEIARISQLTFRTNQFNFTTIRRSEAEIGNFLKRADAGGLVVRVADRFGDYGLVGVVLYLARPDRHEVDTFLLSCRVLGRGVEHAVLADLARRAAAQGKEFVELPCRYTDRNAPARAFIESIRAGEQGETGDTRTFRAEPLARLRYEPDARLPRAEPAADRPTAATVTARVQDSSRSQRIAETLRTAEDIGQAIERNRLGSEADDARGGAPLNDGEAPLLRIWRRVLGRPRIGVHDNFFEAGGTSLKAVQIIAMVKKELDRDLSIVTMFECPTVALLAAKLRLADGFADPKMNDSAATRGRRRRAALREAAST